MGDLAISPRDMRTTFLVVCAFADAAENLYEEQSSLYDTLLQESTELAQVEHHHGKKHVKKAKKAKKAKCNAACRHKRAHHAGKARAHKRFAKLCKKYGLHSCHKRHAKLAKHHAKLAKGKKDEELELVEHHRAPKCNAACRRKR